MRVRDFDAFLIDLDGVVYVGDDPIAGTPKTIRRLRDHGKEVRFVTNDPRPTREEVRSRLASMGIEADLEEIVTVGWASAQRLESQDVRGAYVIGSPGLVEEVQGAGVETWTGPDPPDGEIDVVLAGTDERTDYAQIRSAAQLIRGGARFLATNLDGSFPMPDGRWPGTGAIASAVQAASDRQPIVVGKPEPFVFHLATADLADTDRVLVVGDNPRTDVLGAHRAGFTAALVGSNGRGARTGPGFLAPDASADRLDALVSSDEHVDRWEPPGYAWPDRLAPGVGMVVLDDEGRVLLHRRRSEDAWAPPSGHVERGETVRQAAMRELEEETGLEVELEALVDVVSDPAYQVVDTGQAGMTQFVTSLFRVRATGGDLEGSDEGLAWGWFDPEQLPTPVTDYTRPWLGKALEQVLRRTEACDQAPRRAEDDQH